MAKNFSSDLEAIFRDLYQLPAGYGPLDLYIHSLGFDGAGKVVWAEGGNNPNGTGSVWYHLNN